MKRKHEGKRAYPWQAADKAKARETAGWRALILVALFSSLAAFLAARLALCWARRSFFATLRAACLALRAARLAWHFQCPSLKFTALILSPSWTRQALTHKLATTLEEHGS